MTGASTAILLLALAAGPLPRGSLRERIGVFLRFTGEEDPRKALMAVKSLGLDRVQVSRLPDRFYTAEGASEFAGMLKAADVRADAVVVVFDGESYKDRESVMRTVGLRSADLRPARLAYARRCIDFSTAIGTKIVTLHMGFLPKDPKDTVYRQMLEAAGFRGPLIIENYVWRDRGTDPLAELTRARDFILRTPTP